MGKHKSPRTVSPHAVATISSVLLLIVSAGLGFYFTELRGPGVRTLLAGSQASELLVLFGALAAVILTGHLAVANGARSAQGAGAYRKLVRHASEVDYSDPQVVSQFDAVPELRDMVNVLVSEKQQGQELQDTLESVRGENQGLLVGMERSLDGLSKIREDHPSEYGQKVASLWNSLLDRLVAQEQDVSTAQTNILSAADLFETQTDATSGTHALEQRLQQLEERVQQLQSSVASANAPLLMTDEESVAQASSSLLVAEEESVAPASVPALVVEEEPVSPASVPALVVEEEPVSPASVPALVAEEEPVSPAGDLGLAITQLPITPATSPVLDSEEVAAVIPQDESVVEPAPISVPWKAPQATPPDVGEASHEETSQPEVTAEVESTTAKPWQEVVPEPKDEPVGVAEVSDSSAVGNSFSEWSGEGFGTLAGDSEAPAVGFRQTPKPLESALPEVEPQEKLADPQVPKVAPQPTQDDSEEAGVTYEIEDEIVDLTSLGAVEYKE